MKRLFALSLVAMMGLSLVACGKEEVKDDVYDEETVVEEEATEETAEVAEETAEAAEEVAEVAEVAEEVATEEVAK